MRAPEHAAGAVARGERGAVSGIVGAGARWGVVLPWERTGPPRRVVDDRQPPQAVGGERRGYRVVEGPVVAVNPADRRGRLR